MIGTAILDSTQVNALKVNLTIEQYSNETEINEDVPAGLSDHLACKADLSRVIYGYSDYHN